MLYVTLALSVVSVAMTWGWYKANKRWYSVKQDNKRLRKFLGTVDTNNFLVAQQGKKIKHLTAALSYAKMRLERDFERTALDKIASGEQH